MLPGPRSTPRPPGGWAQTQFMASSPLLSRLLLPFQQCASSAGERTPARRARPSPSGHTRAALTPSRITAGRRAQSLQRVLRGSTSTGPLGKTGGTPATLPPTLRRPAPSPNISLPALQDCGLIPVRAASRTPDSESGLRTAAPRAVLVAILLTSAVRAPAMHQALHAGRGCG